MRRMLIGSIVAIFGLSALWLGFILLWPTKDIQTAVSGPGTGDPRVDGAIRLGNLSIDVEVARTAEERERGLAGRSSLPEDIGMLFLFDEPAPRFFWMRGMEFPIDIVWILGDRVVGVSESVLPEPGVPEDQLRRYASPGPADAVLEVRAGWARERGVRSGDPVRRIH